MRELQDFAKCMKIIFCNKFKVVMIKFIFKIIMTKVTLVR